MLIKKKLGNLNRHVESNQMRNSNAKSIVPFYFIFQLWFCWFSSDVFKVRLLILSAVYYAPEKSDIDR